MTFDIIENNFIRNHKYWFWYKWILFTFLIFISLELFDIIDLGVEYNSLWNIVIFPFIMILTFFNIFAQFKVGELKFEGEMIEIIHNDKARFFKYYLPTKTVIDLDDVQKAKIWPISSKHYIVKLDDIIEYTIKANHTQISSIKNLLINNNISILKTDFISSIKRWFKH